MSSLSPALRSDWLCLPHAQTRPFKSSTDARWAMQAGVGRRARLRSCSFAGRDVGLVPFVPYDWHTGCEDLRKHTRRKGSSANQIRTRGANARPDCGSSWAGAGRACDAGKHPPGQRSGTSAHRHLASDAQRFEFKWSA